VVEEWVNLAPEAGGRGIARVALNRGQPALLAGGSLPLQLRLTQEVTASEDRAAPRRERWYLNLRSYWYTFEDPATDAELLAFHWHPGRGVSHPHVHLKAATGVTRHFLNAHVPTGFVPLESVLRFAVNDLGAQPRVDMDTWEANLVAAYAATSARFRALLVDIPPWS
jgi:hypothetical protein